MPLGAVLFFVTISFLGFAFSGETGVTREGGALRTPSVAANVINVAHGAEDNASFNAPSCVFLSGAASQQASSSLLFSAPEFLSLGEVKDPGMLANVSSSHPGVGANETKSSGNSPSEASFLALRIGRRPFSL